MPKSLDHHELVSAIERDFGFLKFTGEDGCRWLAELQDVKIRMRLTRALDILKTFDLKAGADLLAEIDEEIHTRPAKLHSVSYFLQRYRWTALAYYHYLNGELETAKTDLLNAHEQVRALITCHQFLIPVALHCTDFIIQRARLARRESQWKEAERHIWMIRDIYAGVRPFCVLDSGRSIGVSEIREFYASLPLDEKEREQSLKVIGDTIPLAERITYLEEVVFALPDVVIPYP
jgi:hypothetical protein